MDGIINILKPSGMTSHDVVSFIRKNLNIKKVGHTGTLDPNAAGVLPICIGKGTKLSQYIMQKQKKYRCEMIFGKSTDTLDSYGKVTDVKETENIEFEKIKSILDKFHGEIQQVPPAYSAIKIDGVRLYEKARKGQEIKEIPSRVALFLYFSVVLSAKTPSISEFIILKLWTVEDNKSLLLIESKNSASSLISLYKLGE